MYYVCAYMGTHISLIAGKNTLMDNHLKRLITPLLARLNLTPVHAYCLVTYMKNYYTQTLKDY